MVHAAHLADPITVIERQLMIHITTMAAHPGAGLKTANEHDILSIPLALVPEKPDKLAP